MANASRDMKEIREKLNNWESSSDPLAPLTAIQTDGIAELEAFASNRPLPIHLPLDEIPSLDPVYTTPACVESDLEKLPSCFMDLKLGNLQIDNSQSFLAWFSNVEEFLRKEEDWKYRNYTDQLEVYEQWCTKLLQEVTAALTHLDSLQKQYLFVSTKTNALHDACEHLLAEQTKLVSTAENIKEKLSYFDELDALSQKLGSPTLSVLSETFIPMLSRLDECVSYLEANSQYKEAGTYLSRFQHLLTQALGMIRSYVTSALQQTTQVILPRCEPGLTPENAFALCYGKFRTHAPRILSLMAQIEDRLGQNMNYQHLLTDCHQCYFSQREILLGPSVSTAISELASNHQRDHCLLVRSGCAFLIHLCEDEHQLYGQFFSQPTVLLNHFLERLCARLYDVLRPIIIHIYHLETLAELCSILKVEMLEEHVQHSPTALRAFETIAQQMLEDVQERLAYRTHVYIKTDIRDYNPAPGDVAYPEKLEMMESIAESLIQGTLSRSSSHSSLASAASFMSSNSIPSIVRKSSPTTIAVTSEEAAVLPVTATEHILETNLITQISAEQQNLGVTEIPRQRSLNYSPADLHGMWYPTVRRTLICLSKLYRCLDRTIFQGLSQEVLSMCILSLISASQTISKKKTLLDGQLFQIKHLLILREQIAPFQVDFAIKETALDFSRVKTAAYGLLQKKAKLFLLSSNNALLEFLLEGTPQVTEHLIDSKKAVDRQLKTICEEFIMHTTDLLLGSLSGFLNKAKVLLQVQEQEKLSQVSLRHQPFATPDKTAQMVNESYRHLKAKLPPLQRSLSLYLANRDTEHILFKPIKMKVQKNYEHLIQLIKTNYSEEEQMIIACPSLEQISILLSTVTAK